MLYVYIIESGTPNYVDPSYRISLSHQSNPRKSFYQKHEQIPKRLPKWQKAVPKKIPITAPELAKATAAMAKLRKVKHIAKRINTTALNQAVPLRRSRANLAINMGVVPKRQKPILRKTPIIALEPVKAIAVMAQLQKVKNTAGRINITALSLAVLPRRCRAKAVTSMGVVPKGSRPSLGLAFNVLCYVGRI